MYSPAKSARSQKRRLNHRKSDLRLSHSNRELRRNCSPVAPQQVSRPRVQPRSLQTDRSRSHFSPKSASDSRLTAFAIQAWGRKTEGISQLGYPVAERQVSRLQVQPRSLQTDRSRSHFSPKSASDSRLTAFAIQARGRSPRDLAIRLSCRGATGLLGLLRNCNPVAPQQVSRSRVRLRSLRLARILRPVQPTSTGLSPQLGGLIDFAAAASLSHVWIRKLEVDLNTTDEQISRTEPLCIISQHRMDPVQLKLRMGVEKPRQSQRCIIQHTVSGFVRRIE